MGLTNWKQAPKGKILRTDVTIAKNYLEHKELEALNRIVGMYLDFAENMASRQRPMTMKDWAERLDAFLQFNEYAVLQDAGKISAEVAHKLAEEEYQKYRVIQDMEFVSDFDKEVKRIEANSKKK